jgi:hypothetical protein
VAPASAQLSAESPVAGKVQQSGRRLEAAVPQSTPTVFASAAAVLVIDHPDEF